LLVNAFASACKEINELELSLKMDFQAYNYSLVPILNNPLFQNFIAIYALTKMKALAQGQNGQVGNGTFRNR